MEKMFWRKSGLAMILLGIVLQLVFVTAEGHRKTHQRNSCEDCDGEKTPPAVKLEVMDRYVVMNNEILKVTLAKPEGYVTHIEYNGMKNVLQNNREHDRGYWDIVCGQPALQNGVFRLKATNFSIIIQNKSQVELSFSTTWDPNSEDYFSKSVPLKIDIRYVMLSGVSGFYAYAIFEREERWPALFVDQIRIAFKLGMKNFHYMALSDDMQRIMPEAQDRATGRPLDYPEAVLLTNPSNPDLTGEVDDKYQYAIEHKDDKVHGWISSDPQVGFWIITPSSEFRTGGPFKQELTSHVGPTALAMFESCHYGGLAMQMNFEDGEPWKKVFGPVFLYLNSDSSTSDSISNTTLGHPLWQDAKRQMLSEVESWPYNFPCSSDYISMDHRGTIMGQLLINDRLVREDPMFASFAYVGLAAPGVAGSWQVETKGYQFWVEADEEGCFLIRGIRPGNYSLYAVVPGVLGNYKYEYDIAISPGSEIKLGSIIFTPPRNGPTLWEIGIPDRSAAEFYIPDPNPDLINRLYLNLANEKFRQYGLWDRYTVLYPKEDLIYTVGASDYKKDWFFAHVNRNIGNDTYRPTTWQIKFEIPELLPGTYTLQMALASASMAEVQIRVNDPLAKRPHHSTKLIGRDNAIARHGIHGLYWVFSFEVSSTLLLKGSNTIYLLQNRDRSKFSGVMYDYIRLEGPPTPKL